MFVLWTLLVGLVVGVIAKMLVPGRDPGGVLVTIAIGIGGACLATLVGHAMHWYRADQSPGMVASVIGAATLLVIHRLLVRHAAR